jgi:hypothetical protein
MFQRLAQPTAGFFFNFFDFKLMQIKYLHKSPTDYLIKTRWKRYPPVKRGRLFMQSWGVLVYTLAFIAEGERSKQAGVACLLRMQLCRPSLLASQQSRVHRRFASLACLA